MRRLLIVLGLLLAVPAFAADVYNPAQQGELGTPADSTTLGGGSTYSSFAAHAPCALARSVIFRVASTAAKQCSLVVVQVSDDSSHWTTVTANGGGTGLAKGVGYLDGLASTALGGSPLLVTLHLSNASSVFLGMGEMPFRWARISLTAGYAGNFADLTAFQCRAIVVREPGLEVPASALYAVP